jgi:hypothetical protein
MVQGLNGPKAQWLNGTEEQRQEHGSPPGRGRGGFLYVYIPLPPSKGEIGCRCAFTPLLNSNFPFPCFNPPLFGYFPIPDDRYFIKPVDCGTDMVRDTI